MISTSSPTGSSGRRGVSSYHEPVMGREVLIFSIHRMGAFTSMAPSGAGATRGCS